MICLVRRPLMELRDCGGRDSANNIQGRDFDDADVIRGGQPTAFAANASTRVRTPLVKYPAKGADLWRTVVFQGGGEGRVRESLELLGPRTLSCQELGLLLLA